MKTKKATIVLAIVISSSIFGCATRPSNISASHVSTLKYDNVTCDRLALEASDVESKLSSVSARLESTANKDAAFVAAGFLLWPLWFGTAATGGKADEADVARLKGEKEAIDKSALQKNCIAKK